MQIKEVIESVPKVSSLIIVLNGFEIVARKFCHISRGGKERRRKSPILLESNALYALYAFRV
jgi:hypothetical protein